MHTVHRSPAFLLSDRALQQARAAALQRCSARYGGDVKNLSIVQPKQALSEYANYHLMRA